MKRLTNTLFLLLLTITAVAQDFKLNYAKNVNDVTDFRNLTELDKQLDWHEVSNGAIDGNLDDVTPVKEMLASTRMKGEEDQQLFWKMRDQMLLCFRIDDPNEDGGNFHVEITYGKDSEGNDIKKQLTTQKYFFANMPMTSDYISIDVWRVSDPDQRINFRYWVYDWDNDNVYIFQLDQKRRSTGDTYKMEYVTSYADGEGNILTESNILQLKETKFQSFYLPEGHSLTDIFFLTGNAQEGDVKLRLDLNNIHPTIDIDQQLEIPTLTSTFKLAKHEYRELMNFNWIGTGLFEQYDTLYIKLIDEKGKDVKYATMNVHRVDENGNMVYDTTLKYVNYDSQTKYHKVLTYGHPAYVEILVDGYLPLVYRYKGAADPSTSIVSADYCSATITLRPGNADDQSIAISDQYFRYLKDEVVAITRGDIEYDLVSIDEVNLSGKIASDKVIFMDNGGNDYPKLLDNKSIEKLAQFEVVFSSPKGQSHPECKMVVTEVNSKVTHEAEAVETRIISALEFTQFTRDYFFVRYDMSAAMPYNVECRVALSTGTATYDRFPSFVNAYTDIEEAKDDAESQTAEATTPKDDREAVAGGVGSMDFGFQFPVDFKFSFPGKVSISTGALFDILKQTYNFYVGISVLRQNEGGERTKDKLKAARDNAKKVQNWRYNKVDDDGNEHTSSVSFADPSFKYEDWVATEMESIFNVTAKKVGWYVGGGAKLAMRMPLANIIPGLIPGSDLSKIQLSEISGSLDGGYGMFFTPSYESGKLKKIKDIIETYVPKLELDLGFLFDLNARLDLGIKSYGKSQKYEWSTEDKGFYTNLTLTALAGVWANLITPENPFAYFEAGLRGGVKLQAAGGVMVPFCSEPTCFGLRLMALGGIQAHCSVRTCILDWSGNFSFRAGAQLLAPDNNHNPFHTKFPYWIPDEAKSNIIGKRFRRLSEPLPNSLGRPLATNVFFDANPHFMGINHVVYNDLGTPADYNDDHVKLVKTQDTPDDTEKLVVDTVVISAPGTSAFQHMRSKRGDAEIVVYQQTSKVIDNAAVNEETAAQIDAETQKHMQIKAAIRQADGTWQQTVVTPDDGIISQKPVVSIQEDGKAAVIYQHGTITVIDDTLSAYDPSNQRLTGELQLRTYDPATGWSEPTKMFDINEDTQPLKYDLIMRNDTVLVGAMINEPNNPIPNAFAGKRLRYASKPVNSNKVKYINSDLRTVDFSMSRVGKYSVVSMLYERPDSTYEIYVKTLKMNGTSDKIAGCDLKTGRHKPYKIKIISDRSTDTNDFAILWTEQNNIAYDACEGNTSLKEYFTVLNASRVHLSDVPLITYPLTLGAERDSLVMTDFDGYMDDTRIKVVYTLSDVESNASVIMYNEKEFTNGFESDVTYSREALISNSTLPVNVYVRNIGTSAIQSVSVTINGQPIDIPDSRVQPMTEECFVVQYPIPDDFNGYMQSTVKVVYDNVFSTKMQTTRRSNIRNLLTQFMTHEPQRVTAADIDCNVVSRHVENGVNTFIVEVTDRSLRGLTPGTEIKVGAYVHPSAMETVTADASTKVKYRDFTLVGGVRKAYAELTVKGILEEVPGYIAATIIDLQSNAPDPTPVNNYNAYNSPCFVIFHPTGEPTAIDSPVKDEPKKHRISVTAQEGGLLLGNLTSGDDIRLFNSAGWTIYMGTATSNTHFVPLKRHDVFVVSAADEVFKFTY